MEEKTNLLSGLSLAELKQTKRVQAIRKDVQKKYEARWMRAKQSILQREGQDFLRIRKSTLIHRPSKRAEIAEFDWMLSSVDTLPIEERIRLQRRLQNKIRECQEQLRGLVGLPPMYNKQVKRQRIKTESSAKKRLLSQFTKEGILWNLENRLSKEGGVERASIIPLKSSLFAGGKERDIDEKQQRVPATEQIRRENGQSHIYRVHLPAIDQHIHRKSLGIRQHNILAQKHAQEMASISNRLQQLPCNASPKKRIVVGELKPIQSPRKGKVKKRIPVELETQARPELKSLKENLTPKGCTKIQLSGFNNWRKPLKQELPELSMLRLNSQLCQMSGSEPTNRNSDDMYKSLSHYEQVYAELMRSQVDINSRMLEATRRLRHTKRCEDQARTKRVHTEVQ